MAVDVQRTLAFLCEREERRRAALQRRYARACRDAKRIVRAWAREGVPRRVWQWGSLLHPSRFSEVSDIDLAVEGVADPKEFHRLCAIAEKLTTFPLDIVQLERIQPEFAALIRERGKVVYERE